ncbi:MAG: alpha/beta hydrolase [Methanomassiliicoccaceae archaeon]|jgi:pimeloyl-ACP methyl ester carboxylesterase|nr:alpha/beta hydrolase [Methanomassiliicoccaceae archaeon]
MPIADINGQKINYEVVGEGTPVVLITGFASDLPFWDALIPFLSSHKVIMLDNRGVGRTRHSGKFTTSDLMDDVLALMDHLSLYRAHIVGWSMGGCIAQELSLKYPERVISLTLISAYMRRPARSSFAMRTAIRAVEEGASVETVSMMLQVMCLSESAFIKREEKGVNGNRRPFATTIGGITDQLDAVDAYDSRGRISGISVPTLCIFGLSDIMVPPEVGEEITRLIKGCRPFRVPGAGHIINPSLYQKAMLEHFKDND